MTNYALLLCPNGVSVLIRDHGFRSVDGDICKAESQFGRSPLVLCEPSIPRCPN